MYTAAGRFITEHIQILQPVLSRFLHSADFFTYNTSSFIKMNEKISYVFVGLWEYFHTVPPLQGSFLVVSQRRAFTSGVTRGGLKWTRTTDLTLIRRAL